jgi:hypothetical protein
VSEIITTMQKYLYMAKLARCKHAAVKRALWHLIICGKRTVHIKKRPDELEQHVPSGPRSYLFDEPYPAEEDKDRIPSGEQHVTQLDCFGDAALH